MLIMVIVKYYWSLFRFAVDGAWGFSQLVSAIFAFVGGYIGYKHPEWGIVMNNLLWVIPLGIFVVLFAIRLILAPYKIYKDQQDEIKKLQQQNANLRQQITDLQLKLDTEMNPKMTIGGFVGSVEGNVKIIDSSSTGNINIDTKMTKDKD